MWSTNEEQGIHWNGQSMTKIKAGCFLYCINVGYTSSEVSTMQLRGDLYYHRQ